jgi:prolyl oligopeptidase
MLDDLVARVGDARVVALGEGAHNVVELLELRGALLRELVTRHGFTALVLESGFPEGLALDAWVRGGADDLAEVARTCITYGFGDNEPTRPQLTWLRAHHESGGEIRVYGMDLPGASTSPAPAVRELLGRVPGAPGDEDLRRLSDLGGPTAAAVRLDQMPPGERSWLLERLLALADRADAATDDVARRCGAALRSYVAEQTFDLADTTSPYPRDAFMADTVRWVLEREQRVLVHAHNGHVRRTPSDGRPMLGALLTPALGEDLVVIGTTYRSGPQVRITERSPRPFDWEVALTEGVPGPDLAADAEDFDHLVVLPEAHRVPGAFERLRAEIAGYPATRTVDAWDERAGLRFEDPYRWLESETPEVHAWQRAQAVLATRIAYEGQDPAEVRALVARHAAGERPDLPRWAAGRWYRSVPGPGGGPACIVVADEPLGPGRTVADLATDGAPGAPAVLSWFAPSPDGRLLVYGVCTDGSEHNTVRVVDVGTGEALDAPPQVLHSAWAGGATWRPDGSGFWFFALTGRPEDFEQALFWHRVGPAGAGETTAEPVVVPAGSREYTLVQVSPDGRWAVASHRVGSPVPIAVRDLGDPRGEWRPFVTAVDGTVAGHVLGDRYVAITDVGASRGRVVAIPLEAAEPDDVDQWVELVPEGDAVLRSLTPVGEHLYLSELDQVFARIRVLDRAGTVVGEVPLPGKGAIGAPFFPLTALATGSPAPVHLFAYSSLTTSWGIYGHHPGAAEVEVLAEPEVVLDATIDVGSALAGDGAPVPFHVVRSRGAEQEGPVPVLVTAYGAANIPLLPQYRADLAAFVAAGGTVVQAYLRGGGELGRDWYLGAHRERRHVRDSDLVAVAEHLIATGLTSPDRLALTGGSDGGLMCGVAITTRPDLWCAVLPRAPLLDLVAGMRDPYLDFVIRKAWGDPDDPEDVRRVAGRSPYELVTPQDFPTVYVQAGATDPRCRPWHARKFVARLQTAQEGDRPVVVHVFDNAGHGAATSADVVLEQDAEWLAFLMGRLGLSPQRST